MNSSGHLLWTHLRPTKATCFIRMQNDTPAKLWNMYAQVLEIWFRKAELLQGLGAGEHQADGRYKAPSTGQLALPNKSLQNIDISEQTNKPANRHTNKQTNSQTSKQTNAHKTHSHKPKQIHMISQANSYTLASLMGVDLRPKSFNW